MDKVLFTVNGFPIEVSKDDVSKAIETGSFDVTTDEVVTYSKDGFEKYKKNLMDLEYKNGKVAGEEMRVKEMREKHGLEFEGKTMDNLLDAYQKKVITDANIKPAEQITSLQSDLKTLQNNYSVLQVEYDGFKSNITKEKETFKKDNALLSLMPNNLLVDKDIALMALRTKTGLDISFSETGKALTLINGEIQKDQTLEPIEMTQDFIVSQLTKLNLLPKQEGGRGAGDDTGGGAQGGYDSFVKRMKANGVREGSSEFNEKMQSEMKAGTLKM